MPTGGTLLVGVGDATTFGSGDRAPLRRRAGIRLGALGLAVVVVALVVFALVSGSGSGGGPLNAIAKAAEVTQREPGGHAVIHATIDSSTTPEGLTEAGSMVFDEDGRARGTLTVRGHTTGQEGKVTVIADGATSYTSSALLESLPEGKKWMELDLSSAVASSSSSLPADGGPEEGLKVLEHVEDAEEIGQEDIRGVPTTHYRGTVPTAEEVLGVKVRTSAPQVDVWVDAQGRVRQMSLVVSGGVEGIEGSAVTTAMTIDYVDFERVPKIELPPPDEVFDATSELEAKLQSAAAGH